MIKIIQISGSLENKEQATILENIIEAINQNYEGISYLGSFSESFSNCVGVEIINALQKGKTIVARKSEYENILTQIDEHDYKLMFVDEMEYDDKLVCYNLKSIDSIGNGIEYYKAKGRISQKYVQQELFKNETFLVVTAGGKSTDFLCNGVINEFAQYIESNSPIFIVNEFGGVATSLSKFLLKYYYDKVLDFSILDEYLGVENEENIPEEDGALLSSTIGRKYIIEYLTENITGKSITDILNNRLTLQENISMLENNNDLSNKLKLLGKAF